MSIWNWIYNRRFDAMRNQDHAQIEMIDLFWKMLESMRTNPELSLQYARQARRIAELVNDNWFVQLINHWELQTRFSFLGDYTGTLDLATRAAVEVRLPDYHYFPQRICLHEDLINAYSEQDPIGNKVLIQQALDYMEREVDPSVECYMCLSGLKLDFVQSTGTAEEINQTAQQALKIVETSEHHKTYVYLVLVESAYQQKNWENLVRFASEVESNARKADRSHWLATGMLWLATYAEQTAKLEHAQNLYQMAIERAERYGAFLGRAYYIALTAYHENGGRLQQALETQQTYLALITGKAKPFSASLTQLEIIRLKKALHQPYDDDVLALKQIITALKAPDYILDKLDDMMP